MENTTKVIKEHNFTFTLKELENGLFDVHFNIEGNSERISQGFCVLMQQEKSLATIFMEALFNVVMETQFTMIARKAD